MTEGHAAFGYHLWLAPDGDPRARLQSIIDGLAEAYGGPVFAPHVTLLSGLPVDEASSIETLGMLAAGLGPFPLTLTTPEAGATFFQCVYMRVAESQSLHRTREAARNAFTLPAGDYMPHLSLYYGDVTAERRATILASVPEHATGTFPVKSIQLIRADSQQPVDWHLVHEAPLGGRDAGPTSS